MTWDAIICALAPVAIIGGILLRAILIRRRQRGVIREGVPYSPEDDATTGYEAGRPPIQADKWWPPN